ncbi:MAG TPA: FAD-dependent thymidylate synthase [Allosphingosinicella sp.]|jgi:flavin-dependent thymidylate synthase
MTNKVELLGFYGSDETVALSAWTSTSRELTDSKRARIPNLLETLWSNKHETPFEKVNVHFLVDSEIASHIQLLKHRIASINGESARYKELKEDKYYLPEDWNIDIARVSKDVIQDEQGERWIDILEGFNIMGNKLYHQCLEDLTPILGRKRAKESARFFKTYSSQIQVDIQFNMRSFANFIKLRNSEHAQLEIREIAQVMWDLVQNETEGKLENILKVIDNRIKFEEKCEKYKELIMSLDE